MELLFGYIRSFDRVFMIILKLKTDLYSKATPIQLIKEYGDCARIAPHVTRVG